MNNIKVLHKFPTDDEFLYLFKSVGWERSIQIIHENRKHSFFAVSVYSNNKLVAMGRVVGDGAYFTIFDVVTHKNSQGQGFGSLVMEEIIKWYKTIKDNDTFLYVNASKGREIFYEKFGFRQRPNEDVGAGMKWYEN